MGNRFDQILDICLDKVCNKQQSIASCLQEFPAYKKQLEPLLTTALETQNLFGALLPDPQKKQNAYHRIMGTGTANKTVSKPRTTFLRRYQRWVSALAASVIILMTGGLTTASVSAGAISGDSLYPIKRGTQNLRLFFTPSGLSKAEYHAQLADDRAEEVGRLILEGREKFIPQVVLNIKKHLTEVRNVYGEIYPLARQSGEEVYAYKPPNLTQKQKESRTKSYGLLSKGYKDKQKYLQRTTMSEQDKKEFKLGDSLSQVEREYTLTLSSIRDTGPIRPKDFKPPPDGINSGNSATPRTEKSEVLKDFRGQLVAVSPVTGMMIILDDKGVETVVRVTSESVIDMIDDAELQNNLSIGDDIEAKINPKNRYLIRLHKHPKPYSKPVKNRKTR